MTTSRVCRTPLRPSRLSAGFLGGLSGLFLGSTAIAVECVDYASLPYEFPEFATSGATNVRLTSTHAYVTRGVSGLLILDVEDRDAPVQVGSVSMRHRSPGWPHVFAVLAVIGASWRTEAGELPPGGTTRWEMEELEVVVTFLLFDPEDPGIASPEGLRFISLREMDAPEFQDHWKKNPEQSDWAFSFVEFVRPKTWVLDGRAPTLPENGCMGVWFAPVDHSQLAAQVPSEGYERVIAPSPDAVLVLGLWIPDPEHAAYVRSRGHRAEYGMATLIEDGQGTFHGELQLDDLTVKASATPRGEVPREPDPFTQVFFEPGETVERVVVLAGRNARERDCAADWSMKGDHPLSRGVLSGPTFLNVERPLETAASTDSHEEQIHGEFHPYLPLVP